MAVSLAKINKPQTVSCGRCGFQNGSSAKFCAECGFDLSKKERNTLSTGLDDKTIVNMEEYYKAAIGSKNQNYYLRVFHQFDKNGKVGLSWHWPAFFVTIFWLLYRKMWLNTIAYLAFTYFFTSALEKFLLGAGFSKETLGMIYFIEFLAIFIIPSLYANNFYYWHVKKKIMKSKLLYPDIQKQLFWLSAKGGVSVIWAVLCVVISVSIVGTLVAVVVSA